MCDQCLADKKTSQNSVAQAQNQNQRVLQKLTPSIFSTSIGQYSQQQQTVPGVRISINELRPTTRFNDLHEELQKVIESVDNFILNQMKYRDECDALLPKVIEKASPISNDVEYCSKTLETTQIALENDAEAIAYGKLLVKTDVSNAKLSFRIIQNLKMPQQFHHSGLWNAPNVSQVVGPPLIDDHVGSSKNLVSYFSQEIDDMSKTLEKYKRSIAEVEAYLKSVEDNTYHQMRQIAFVRGPDGGAKSAEDQIRELAAVLKEFENGILGVAGKVGSSREKVQEVMLGNYGNGNSRIRRV